MKDLTFFEIIVGEIGVCGVFFILVNGSKIETGSGVYKLPNLVENEVRLLANSSQMTKLSYVNGSRKHPSVLNFTSEHQNIRRQFGA